jgi:hypothetical protein
MTNTAIEMTIPKIFEFAYKNDPSDLDTNELVVMADNIEDALVTMRKYYPAALIEQVVFVTNVDLIGTRT